MADPAARTVRLPARDTIHVAGVGAEIFCLRLVFDANEHHFRSRDIGLWILDIFQECCLVPDDAGILVGIGVVVTGHGARLTTFESIQ